ncbi:MAG: hypothetical protein QM786_00435 [Breznakibacter sp.]
MNIRNFRKIVFVILILIFSFVLLKKNRLINDYTFVISDFGLLKTFTTNHVLSITKNDTVYYCNGLLILNIKPQYNNHFVLIKKNNIIEWIVLVRQDTTVLYMNENNLIEKNSNEGNWYLLSANMATNIIFKELGNELVEWKLLESRFMQNGFNADVYGINNIPKEIEFLGIYSTEKIPSQVFYFSNSKNGIKIDCFNISRVVNIGIN